MKGKLLLKFWIRSGGFAFLDQGWGFRLLSCSAEFRGGAVSPVFFRVSPSYCFVFRLFWCFVFRLSLF
ncbi:unnamed protein product [Meloidogyne enterolobii]|uniref:Uncharacterized protein n=1 Tax=Meloidogyne enterolobii TaxID=390850 RepID=A0ACB1ANA0_MELEN